MNIAPLISLLQGTGAVSSLLASAVNAPAPAPAAVYDSVLPRGYKLPAIVVHRYGGVQEQDMSGPVDIREDSFQLDVYANQSAVKESATDACRTLLTGYTGTLEDGTVVLGTYLDQDRDMPFLPNANPDNTVFRGLLAFRFISKV